MKRRRRQRYLTPFGCAVVAAVGALALTFVGSLAWIWFTTPSG